MPFVQRAPRVVGQLASAAAVASMALAGCGPATTTDVAPSTSTATSAGSADASPSSSSSPPEPRPVPDPSERITEPRGNVVTVGDAGSDVASSRGSRTEDAGAADPTVVRPDPRRRQGDIVGVRLVHAATHVFVGVRLAELRSPYHPAARQRRENYFVTAHLDTSTGRYEVVTRAGEESGERTYLVRLRGDQSPTVRCEGLAGGFDYRLREVRFAVPKDCLEDPAWVAVGADFELHEYTYPMGAAIDVASVRGCTGYAQCSVRYSARAPAP